MVDESDHGLTVSNLSFLIGVYVCSDGSYRQCLPQVSCTTKLLQTLHLSTCNPTSACHVMTDHVINHRTSALEYCPFSDLNRGDIFKKAISFITTASAVEEYANLGLYPQGYAIQYSFALAW